MKSFDACVVGLGYIGLPTSIVLVEHGMRVLGVDVSRDVVSSLRGARAHIEEQGVEARLQAAIEGGRFEVELAPRASDVFLIAVPTPVLKTFVDDKSNVECDLTFVRAAVEAIAPVLRSGDLVILESTSSIGTTESIVSWLTELRPDLPIASGDCADGVSVAYCPERVLPGRTFVELIENDRVIGGVSGQCTDKAVAFYQQFVKGECLKANAKTAEMVKLTENTFRDINIAFANELSIIAHENDVDVWELISLANRHPRVDILEPGPGVGGHCIAVDPWFLAAASENSVLIKTAREVNDQKPEWVIEKILDEINQWKEESEQPPTVVLFGITFKPNIDDIRESPALKVLEGVCDEAIADAKVRVVDPFVKRESLRDVKLINLAEGLRIADIAVMLVAHDQFKNHLPETDRRIDTKGIWSSGGVTVRRVAR